MNDRVTRTNSGAGITGWTFGVIEDDNGVQLVPVSATLELTNNGKALPSDGVASVSAGGAVSYAWGPNDIATLNAGTDPYLDVRGLWTFSPTSGDVEKVRFVDIVAVDIDTGIRSSDVNSARPELRSGANKITGTAESGTTTVLTDTGRLSNWRPNELAGSELRIMSGANRQSVRMVLGSDPIAGTLEIDKALPYAFAPGDRYEIVTAWGWQISEAYRVLLQRVASWVGRESAAAIAAGADIREAHLYLAIAYALRSIPNSPESTTAATEYARDSQSAFQRAQIRYEAGAAEGLEIPTMVVFGV